MNHRAPEALPFPSGAGRGGGTGARLGREARSGPSDLSLPPLAFALALPLCANALLNYLSVLCPPCPPQPTVWSPLPLHVSSFWPPTPSPLSYAARTPLLSPASHHRNNHAQNIRLHGQAALAPTLAAGPELARVPRPPAGHLVPSKLPPYNSSHIPPAVRTGK